MGKKFNRWLRAAAKAGINVGDINQASATYLGGGGAGQAAAKDFKDSQAAAEQQKAQQELVSLQKKRLAQQQAADAEARRQAAIMDARRKKLEAQRTVGGRKSSSGQGGLKLSGVKRGGKRARRGLRAALSNKQRTMALQIKKAKSLNLG